MKLGRQSFAGGEITPELLGRLDLGKNQTGLATCKNFVVLPHGPVQNRPGFKYVLEAKDSTRAVRIISFAFSATQTMVLEFGHQYIRFHTEGTSLLETAQNITGITRANPGVLTYAGADNYANGDMVYATGIVGMTQLNGRYMKVANVNTGANTFELTDLAGANIDTTAFTAWSSGGTIARVYSLASPYDEADLFDIHFTQSADILTLVHPSYAPRELARTSATVWTLTTPAYAPIESLFYGCTATPSAAGATTYHYVLTGIFASDGTESAKTVDFSCTNDLATAGHYNTITASTAFPAGFLTRAYVYRLKDGVYGYVGQAGFSGVSITFTDNNITPDATLSPPEGSTMFATTDNYPAAVTYSEQRKVLAGTNTAPQTFWMTRVGTEYNLTSSIPSQDDDSIEATISSRQQNAIRHLVPLSDLIALTASGEWRIGAGDSASAITPSTLSAKPQGYSGASNTQPAVTSNSILFVQAQGSRLRELNYSWEQGRYASTDLSIMAPHLVDGYTLDDLAFSRAPLPTLWAVRSDGALLGLTYVPEHQVYAWHQHVTDGGYFESVAVVAENNEDVLYAVVRRTVNSRTVRYIERMNSRFFTDKADAFVVDSGLTYSGAAATTLTGLHHLEGKTVSILADGAVQTQKVVTAGSITLSESATKVQVGLPITADLKTLPVAVMGAPASGQGTIKNVAGAYLRVYRTTGLSVGPDFDRLTVVPARQSEAYGTSPDLRTEEIHTVIRGDWNTDAAICIRQTDPLPVTLLSLTLDVAAGG